MPLRWLRTPEHDAAPASPAVALVAYLARLLPARRAPPDLLDDVAAFRSASSDAQIQALPGLYLRFEAALGPARPGWWGPGRRERLREDVRRRFPTLLAHEGFGLLFEPEARQEVLLSARLLDGVLGRVQEAGDARLQGFVQTLRGWLGALPSSRPGPAPPGFAPPAHPAGWNELLQQVGLVVLDRLTEALGGPAAERAFEAAYADLARSYGSLPAFNALVALLPDGLLDEGRLARLSLPQMRRVLLAKAEALGRSITALRTRNEALEAAQQALAAASEDARAFSARLGAVLSTVGEGIISADEDGYIVYLNQEAERIFGRDTISLVGRPLTVLMPEPYREAHRQGFARFIETRAPRILGRRVEMEGVRADGTAFPLEIRIVETRVGHERHFTAAVRDITERRAQEHALVVARDEAEEMARLKSAFLANMSHEIRTPLTAILGFADLLADELPPDKHEFVGYIQTGGRRLLDTLNSVLDIARLEAGAAHLSLAPCDVGEEARAAVRLYAHLAEARGLTMEADVPGEPVVGRVDRIALGRVLSNLIGNAIKFTDQGRVVVRVVGEAGAVRVEVEDTGVGIEPAFLPFLFDEFRQESEGITRSHQGAGLGLALSRRLVALMGGTLTVTSTKGAGSTFTVRLARAGPEDAPVA